MMRTDTERLEWMVKNFASFGQTCRTEVQERPNGLPPVVVSETRVFVRVGCAFTYEWHCFDGATFRDAIDAAMAAPPCAGELGDCTARKRWWSPNEERPNLTARDAAEDGQ